MRLCYIAVANVLLSFALCHAEEAAVEPAHDGAAPAVHAPAAPEAPHPTPSPDPSWARPLIVAILVMFVAAIAIGMLVRSRAPQEIPVAQAHDAPAEVSANHHT
jgi:hypothetical protein